MSIITIVTFLIVIYIYVNRDSTPTNVLERIVQIGRESEEENLSFIW